MYDQQRLRVSFESTQPVLIRLDDGTVTKEEEIDAFVRLLRRYFCQSIDEGVTTFLNDIPPSIRLEVESRFYESTRTADNRETASAPVNPAWRLD